MFKTLDQSILQVHTVKLNYEHHVNWNMTMANFNGFPNIDRTWNSNVYDTHRRVVLPKRFHFHIDRYAHEYKVKYKIDAAHFFIQNPFIVVNNKQRDSYWAQNEETRDEESVTVDDDCWVIVPNSGFDKPGNS